MIRALRGASDEVVLAISKEFASIPVERRFSKVCKAARRGMHAMNILRLSQMVMIHQAHEMEVEVVDGGDFGGGDWRRDCGKEAEPHERQLALLHCAKMARPAPGKV